MEMAVAAQHRGGNDFTQRGTGRAEAMPLHPQGEAKSRSAQ